MLSTSEFCNSLEAALAKASIAAKESPGPYGGRYVGRWKYAQSEGFDVLDHDDPDRVNVAFDVYAHVTPERSDGVGFARMYINHDFTVDRSQFEDR